MAQEMVPEKGGTMSSLIIGFAWGMAGLAMVAIGALADSIGLKNAIDLLWYLPVMALAIAVFLPGAVVGVRS
jgi:hypothetical protein